MDRARATARVISLPMGPASPRVFVVSDSDLLAEALTIALSVSGIAATTLRASPLRRLPPEHPIVVIDGPAARDTISSLAARGHAVVLVRVGNDPPTSEPATAATFASGSTIGDLTRLLEALTLGRPAPSDLTGPGPTPTRTVTEAMLIRERLERLTRRERQILGALADGHRPAAIARRLFVSLHTVRTHIRSLLGKLEVHSQLEAVVAAGRAGWQRPDDD